MTAYGHNARAFSEWYCGESDSYWCTIHETEHFNESDCEEIQDFANGLSETLVSDDAVDIEIWRATHIVEANAIEAND